VPLSASPGVIQRLGFHIQRAVVPGAATGGAIGEGQVVGRRRWPFVKGAATPGALGFAGDRIVVVIAVSPRSGFRLAVAGWVLAIAIPIPLPFPIEPPFAIPIAIFLPIEA
jgi:hypothetical protein